MSDHRHDETIATIQRELEGMTSDDERTRASAIATIAQAVHLAMLADPLASETAAKVRDGRTGPSQ